MTADEKIDKLTEAFNNFRLSNEKALADVKLDIHNVKNSTDLIASHLESELVHTKKRISDLEDLAQKHNVWHYGDSTYKGCVEQLTEISNRLTWEKNKRDFTKLHLAAMWIFITSVGGLVWWGFELVWRHIPVK